MMTTRICENNNEAADLWRRNAKTENVTHWKTFDDINEWYRAAAETQTHGAIVVATPPCQDFSGLGDQRGVGGQRGNLGALGERPRLNALWRPRGRG